MSKLFMAVFLITTFASSPTRAIFIWFQLAGMIEPFVVKELCTSTQCFPSFSIQVCSSRIQDRASLPVTLTQLLVTTRWISETRKSKAVAQAGITLQNLSVILSRQREGKNISRLTPFCPCTWPPDILSQAGISL